MTVFVIIKFVYVTTALKMFIKSSRISNRFNLNLAINRYISKNLIRGNMISRNNSMCFQ